MARQGMNPKTLQYIMGHSDIAVTMNVYTHLGLDDAREELVRLKEARNVMKLESVMLTNMTQLLSTLLFVTQK